MKHSILRLAAALGLAALAQAASTNDYTWHVYGGHRYALTRSTGTWIDHEAEAVALGGHLVTINSEEENIWVATTFDHVNVAAFHGSEHLLVQIGYYYSSDRDAWEWISGEPVTYVNLYSIFPEEGTHAYLHEVSHFSPYTWNAAREYSEPGWHELAYGVIEIGADPDGPPIVLAQPSNREALSGTDVDLSVYAFGLEPLAYQWQFNGQSLPEGGRWSGTGSRTLRIAEVTLAEAGAYSVVVSNAKGSVTSAPAVLSVLLRPPAITGEPVDQSVQGGAAVTFTVASTGSLPLTYQWQRNGVGLVDTGRISGVRTATLSLSAVGLEDLGNYSVTVRNAYGSATSVGAALSVVLEPPEITTEPSDQSVFSGLPVTFSVTATGSLPLSYQWQRNGVDLTDTGHIAGAQTATLSIAGADLEDLGLYSVVVRNAYGWVTSFPAELGVMFVPPTITVQPQPQTVALGSPVTLRVQATGSLPLTYRWQCEGVDLVDGARITGAHTSTLTVAGVELGDLGNYSVIVENSLGWTESKAVSLATFSVVLQIRQDGVQMVLSWNEAGKGVKLQQATRLGDPDWQDVPGSESATSVTLPLLPSGSAFFRLKFEGPQVDPARFAWIAPGTFVMGYPANIGPSTPQTTVTLTRGFWMGRYEVTQREYLAVTGRNPAHYKSPAYPEDLDRPVESVNWNDAVGYCAKLTEQERAAGRLPQGWIYRLPTEAQWEYACRAGTTTRFFFGDASECDLDGCGFCALADPYVWWCGNDSIEGPNRVGQKLPNPWGMYDMPGNVAEWCLNWWSEHLPGGNVVDPAGPATGSTRAIRGSGWIDPRLWRLSSCDREDRYGQGFTAHDIGFRVVLAPAQP